MMSASECPRRFYVKNISAEKTEKSENPRLSAEKPEARRAACACAETQERQDAPCGITRMLKKKYKLPVQEYVRKDGRATHTVYFSLRAFPVALPHPRVGVLVSLRTARKATERNRMKRLVFNFFRLHRAALAGGDTLVTVRPPAAALSSSQLVRELAAAASPPPAAAPRRH